MADDGYPDRTIQDIYLGSEDTDEDSRSSPESLSSNDSLLAFLEPDQALDQAGREDDDWVEQDDDEDDEDHSSIDGSGSSSSSGELHEPGTEFSAEEAAAIHEVVGQDLAVIINWAGEDSEARGRVHRSGARYF